jgi:hypothetical protein
MIELMQQALDALRRTIERVERQGDQAEARATTAEAGADAEQRRATDLQPQIAMRYATASPQRESNWPRPMLRHRRRQQPKHGLRWLSAEQDQWRSRPRCRPGSRPFRMCLRRCGRPMPIGRRGATIIVRRITHSGPRVPLRVYKRPHAGRTVQIPSAINVRTASALSQPVRGSRTSCTLPRQAPPLAGTANWAPSGRSASA